MLVSLTSFSQIGTDSSNSKTFTVAQMKLIAKDLVSGDSAKAQLSLSNEKIKLLESVVYGKDTIISKLEEKNKNFEKIVKLENDKFNIQEKEVDRLNKELKKEKRKNLFNKIFGGALIVLLGTFSIIG